MSVSVIWPRPIMAIDSLLEVRDTINWVDRTSPPTSSALEPEKSKDILPPIQNDQTNTGWIFWGDKDICFRIGFRESINKPGQENYFCVISSYTFPKVLVQYVLFHSSQFWITNKKSISLISRIVRQGVVKKKFKKWK